MEISDKTRIDEETQVKKTMQSKDERYRVAFEYTGTGMMVTDTDMTILMLNQTLSEVTGYTREELEGKRKWTEFVAPHDRERVEKNHGLRRQDPSQVPTSYEFQYRHRDGSLHDALVTVSMIPGTDQSLISVIDITGRKQMERLLLEQKEKYRDLFENANDIIYTHDCQGNFTSVNKAGIITYGYTVDEVLGGLNIRDIVDPAYLSIAQTNLRQKISGVSDSNPYELLTRTKSNKPVWIEVHSRVIRENGRPVSIQGIIRDITARKMIEQKLLESEERFRSVFTASPIGIVLLDVKGTIIDMNRSFKSLFGLLDSTSADKINFSIFDHIKELAGRRDAVIGGDKLSCESDHDFRFVKQGDAYEVVYTGNRSFEWHIVALGARGSGKVMLLAQVADITQRKEMEEARLNVAKQDAEREKRIADGLRKELFRNARFCSMVSRNPQMQEIFKIVSEVAPTAITLLITGESGTGKELIARSVHELSDRKTGPFVAINCGAFPDTLLESELFGYKAGAFTDAKKDKLGKFMAANGGTLFLDEIGDITPAMQVKLLRVLQERCIEPLGATRIEPVDVRIIAATNKNLVDMVKTGTFREDLYYRIKVITLRLPPLRERKVDIPLLCDHFISLFNARYKKNIKEPDAQALDIMLTYPFPGNVRELENVLEHACIFCKGSVIEPRHLPQDVVAAAGSTVAVDQLLPGIKDFDALERLFVQKILIQTNGNKMQAARLLGVHKTTLFRKLKRLSIE